VPEPRFEDCCPACGWIAYDINVPVVGYRDWGRQWIADEQAVKMICPSCGYTWKRLAEEPKRAFILGVRFEEKS
jgi:hypothetical protein